MVDESDAARRLHFCLLPFYFCLPSVSVQLRDGAVYVLDLREDCVFELRSVGDEGVERGDATHGRVQVFKKLFGDARGKLRAEAVRARVLVRDDELVCLADARGDRLPVVGRERAQVYDLCVDALLLLGVLRGDERALDERTVGDDG